MLCDVVERVAVSGNTLVATTLLDGLVVLGVEPGGAELLGTFDPEGCWTFDARIAGDVVHVLLPNGQVQQVDIADPKAPRSLGVEDNAFRSVVAETGDGYMQVPSRMLLGATVKTYQVVAQQ